MSYPFDAMYTRNSCGLLVVQPTQLLRGVSLGLGTVPVRVMGSLSTFSFLSWIFPIPRKGHPACDLDYMRGFVVGGVSGAVGSAFAYPLDTVRRRVMVDSSVGFRDAYLSGRLLRGLGVHMAKSCIECGLLSAAYIVSLRYM